MYEKQVWAMKVIVVCVFGIVLTLVIGIFAGEIKVHKIPNQASFQVEVESDDGNLRGRPVRRSLGFFVVTAYCPGERCCGELKLDIPGYGIVPVLDRGGKIKGRKLDVFYPTHQEALEWGTQELEIHCWVEGE